MNFDDEYTDTSPSKTQDKRDAANLQATGEQLMALTPTELARLPLTTELQRGLDEAKRITSKEARRRHAQFIGKLMRRAEHADIEKALAALLDPSRQQRLARWLEQLELAQNQRPQQARLLQQLLDWFPHTDRQHLRNLIRNLTAAASGNSDDALATDAYKRARQKLHRYLVELDRQAPLLATGHGAVTP